MAKGAATADSIKHRKKVFVGNKIDTVGTFRALEVEKSLLTHKSQNVIKRSPWRKILV